MMLPDSQQDTGGLSSRFSKGGVNGEGMMRFTGNEEINSQREEDTSAAREAQSQPIILNLAGEIRTKWGVARDSKQDIQTRMENNLRQRKGEYEPNDLSRIQEQGGSEVYINITNVKCRAAESWVYDLLLPPGERPWAVKPTPMAELPPGVEDEIKMGLLSQIQEAMQMNMQAGIPVDEAELKDNIEQLKKEVLQEVKAKARKEAELMEEEIDDDLVEGGWYQALRECVPDIITLPAGIIEGPIVQKKKKLSWAQYPDGTPMAQTTEEPQRTYKRVSPFDIYPSPGSKSINDGYLCHHIRFERKDLNNLIGVEGFDENAIRLVLQQYGQGGLREWMTNDISRTAIENRPPEFSRNAETSIDCIKFMGPVQGIQLLRWGMSAEQVPDSLLDYEVTAYLIGQYIIGAALNKHPLGRRNYFAASFEQSNTSIWGKGVPELMDDIQKICNGCGRAMVNNMSMASGPQVTILTNLLAEGETMTSLIPWKIWRMVQKGDSLGRRPPVEFFQPQSIVDQLLKVYEHFFQQASEVTGIPSYVYGGSDIGGAGNTASGLSMLMNAASKGLKTVASHIDVGIIKPSIEETWLHIMIYEPEKARGDISIRARASEYLIMMEQLQIRRMEFLNATNNPTDMEIVGTRGRTAVLKETVRALKMPVDDVIPDPDSIANQKAETQQIQMMITNIATAIGADPQQLMQIAVGQPQQGQPQPGQQQIAQGAQPGQSQGLAPSGDRTGGQDFSLAA